MMAGSRTFPGWIRATLNWVLYSNLWIAFAAVVMSWQTEFLLLHQLSLRPLHVFIFAATVFTYALHRVIALHKLMPFLRNGRFAIIERRQRDILLYAVLAGLVTLISYCFLPRQVQRSAIIPGLLALGYILPLLRKGRRLRDIHYLKIFLIAAVWTWVTVCLPAEDFHLGGFIPVWIMAVERAFFIFAITIPFDIRDWVIDQAAQVKTLPQHWGVQRARRIAAGLLLAMAFPIVLNYLINAYSPAAVIAFGLSIASTFFLLIKATPDKHDYYYTALLDGTMILQAVLIFCLAG